MDKIWANRLIAGTQTFDDVPEKRRDGVKAELQRRMDAGEITQEQYEKIVGEERKA